MICVNKIYRFYTPSRNHLGFTLYTSPKMYVLKESGYTIVVYPNGKGRIMGRDASLANVLKHLPEVNQIQPQSKTYVLDLGVCIDLDRVPYGFYEPELFASRTIHRYNVMINQFHNGKVVVMGRVCNKWLLKHQVLPYLNDIVTNFSIAS